MSSREPNSRYYQHVPISPDDFSKPDAWEFYLVVKSWPEFEPAFVQRTEDERILKDISQSSIVIGAGASLKAILIWHAKGIKLENYEYWLSHHVKDYEQVKHIQTVDSAIQSTISDLFTLTHEIKDFINNEGDSMNLEDFVDCLDMLNRFHQYHSLEPHRNRLLELLQEWESLKQFQETYQIHSRMEELFNELLS